MTTESLLARPLATFVGLMAVYLFRMLDLQADLSEEFSDHTQVLLRTGTQDFFPSA
jgi:hypothetical protein